MTPLTQERMKELEGLVKAHQDAGDCSVLERDLWQALCAANEAREADRVRLDAMLPLFEEARDALTALSVAQCKLHGIRLDLADRMDDVGIPERWKARCAAIALSGGEGKS